MNISMTDLVNDNKIKNTSYTVVRLPKKRRLIVNLSEETTVMKTFLERNERKLTKGCMNRQKILAKAEREHLENFKSITVGK